LFRDVNVQNKFGLKANIIKCIYLERLYITTLLT
jgi:hypothetical protein